MSQDGFIFALHLDGEGHGQPIDPADDAQLEPDKGFVWLHLDYREAEAQRWLRQDSGISFVNCLALLSDDPRPRSAPVGDALMVIMRGVNLNKGSAPEDMVSLRMWFEADRVITLRHRRIDTLRAIRNDIRDGNAPASPGALLISICERILLRIARVVDTIDDDVSMLEAQGLTTTTDAELRHRLSRFRRQAISLRRYIAPQRDVLSRLQIEKASWLSDDDRLRLRESYDRLTRSIEELDAAKERAMVTQEELTNRMSELMNRRLYTLSIVAAIFLPLGFIVGTLGVNVGGIPGTESPWGFAILCVALLGTGLTQVWLFRRLGWL